MSEVNQVETIARGICVRDGKILLCRPKNGTYAYLPGGHIELGEIGRDALKREMKEETSLDVEVTRFRGVVENVFEQKGEKHSEINLVYDMEIPAKIEVESAESWIEFVWCELERLEEINLLPKSFKVLGCDAGYNFTV